MSVPNAKAKTGREKLVRLLLVAMMTAVLTVCAWITVPTPVPFTLQTLGVFLTLLLLGGRDGTLSVLLYLAAGAAGVPVFSGFKGGFGVLAGPTGGYLLGFLVTCLLFWLVTSFRRVWWTELVSLSAGLLLCYAFGTVWFLFSTGGWSADNGVRDALMLCVVPFLLPDGVKLALAFLIARRVNRIRGTDGSRAEDGSSR